MERTEILKAVNEIFCDVLDDSTIVVTDNTCSDDIEDWDSLTNIQLVVAIEKELGVKFVSSEIMAWSNVGEMINSIQSKMAR